MKNFILFIFVVCFVSCGTTKYITVPVETIKTETEFVEKWHRDSVYIHDSVVINKGRDTVYFEKYRYIYKDKLVRDSIFITDSVRVEIPYPVETIKEVNRLYNWQIILMCLGGGLIGYVVFKIFRKLKP